MTRFLGHLLAVIIMVGLAGCGSAPLPPISGPWGGTRPTHAYDGPELPEEDLARIEAGTLPSWPAECSYYSIFGLREKSEIRPDSGQVVPRGDLTLFDDPLEGMSVFVLPGHLTLFVNRTQGALSRCFEPRQCLRFDMDAEAGHQYELTATEDDHHWFRDLTTERNVAPGVRVAENTSRWTNACESYLDSIATE